ncbi:unnamed protein product [Prunus armeniaca]
MMFTSVAVATTCRGVENSRFSILVLSRKYAHSIRCLNELEKIVKCRKEMGQAVLAVYFDVDPAEVQKQGGNLEHVSVDHIKKVSNWSAALLVVPSLPGWHARDRAIEVLIENSLVTILDNKVMMDRFIQETGQEIVSAESLGERGKQSRLWLTDDILDVLGNNKGTDAVEGIDIHFPELEEAQWNEEAFSNMPSPIQAHYMSTDSSRRALRNGPGRYKTLHFFYSTFSPMAALLPLGYQNDEIEGEGRGDSIKFGRTGGYCVMHDWKT